MTKTDYISYTAAAEILGVSRYMIVQMIEEGQIESHRIGRRDLIRHSDCERFYDDVKPDDTLHIVGVLVDYREIAREAELGSDLRVGLELPDDEWARKSKLLRIVEIPDSFREHLKDRTSEGIHHYFDIRTYRVTARTADGEVTYGIEAPGGWSPTYPIHRALVNTLRDRRVLEMIRDYATNELQVEGA